MQWCLERPASVATTRPSLNPNEVMMDMDNPGPVVTVGIPTRNRPELLRNAIASVFAQSFSDWRLLVSDNGNLPANRAVVRSFADSRVTYVAQESDLGIVGNFNYLLANAGTPLCAILHDDDEYHPEYLAWMVEAMHRLDDAGWAFCDAAARDGGVRRQDQQSPVIDGPDCPFSACGSNHGASSAFG